jgi:hypothetical protein
MVRIGSGAGFSGDRIEPAVELAEHGDLDYLVFECLAERTIALAQQARARDSNAGYDALLVDRLEAVLPACRNRGVRIVTNMGAANPLGAARAAADVARRLGLRGLSISAVTGDDVLPHILRHHETIAETGEPVASLGDRLVSANAYIGAQPIVDALAGAADLVITGRAADPSLFLAPLRHEFGWAADAWTELARGTLVGHLLECAGQVTGGYFADPGCKDVHGLAELGFPLAEVPDHGPFAITKVAGTGGLVTRATCTEQLLYEIHDPAAYVTPDVVADFSGVRIHESERDRVSIDGAAGRPRPDRLKVSLGYMDGHVGEGQISYAGSGAVERARLAGEVVVSQLRRAGFAAADIRCDLIGVDALHGAGIAGADRVLPYEVRLRVAARAATAVQARAVGNAVEALYTNGPAGGGGAMKSTREILSMASTFIDRHFVSCSIASEIVS